MATDYSNFKLVGDLEGFFILFLDQDAMVTEICHMFRPTGANCGMGFYAVSFLTTSTTWQS